MASQRPRATPRSKASPSLLSERDVPMTDNPIPKQNHRQSHNTSDGDRTPVSSGHGATPATTTDSGTSEHDVDAGAKEGDSEDDDDDSDHLDALAPPSTVKNTSHQPLDGEEVWAGPDEDSAMADYSDSETGDPEPAFDLPDDDDDYDDVDRLSVTSDDSKNFEADVEQEILAAGEGGIDWDDEDTYGYTTDWRESQYMVPAIDVSLQPALLGFSIFDFDLDDKPTPTAASFPTEAPVLRDGDLLIQPTDASAPVDWPSSSSAASEQEGTSPSRRTSQATGITGETFASLQTESGYETDDEEFPVPTISSPALTLSLQTPQRSLVPFVDKRITAATPPRKGLKPPVMQHMKISSKKPVAYTVDGPHGRIVRFKTPKKSNLKWVDLPRRDTGSEISSPSSPTMIDLNTALAQGNTRTGAYITDVINGQMFRQYHCSQVPDVIHSEPSSFAEFARVPLLNGVGFGGLLIEDTDGEFIDGQSHDDALDLIDFDGGVTTEESNAEKSQDVETTDAEMTDATDIQTSVDSPMGKGKGKATETPHVHQVAKPSISNNWQKPEQSSSRVPLKRQPSALSEIAAQKSIFKKKRVDTST